MVDVFELSRGEFLAELEKLTTPENVWENAHEIYEYLAKLFQQNCMDSVLREWTFQWYCEKTGDEYDSIYNKWLQSEEGIKQALDYINKFQIALQDGGDWFFSTDDPFTDMRIIKATLARQGYWAGATYRYFFNDDMTINRIEERRFGL